MAGRPRVRRRAAQYRYTYKRQRALHKAQLVSARKRKGQGWSTKKKLAVAGGVGVIAAGVGAVVYGRTVLKGGPKNVTKTVPPQAVKAHTPRLDAPPWQIGDKVHPEPGDAIELSLKNAITGKGYTRLYGRVVSQMWGRHDMLYRVEATHPTTGARFYDFVPNSGITGVKVGGAANLSESSKALQEERKRHRY